MAHKTSKIPDPQLYQKITKDYQKSGSVMETSKNCRISEVTVRRVLITEGLWSSKTSQKINELYNQGKTVSEIASALSVTEKAVQSYLPYSRGMYGTVQTDNAEYSKNYRERITQAQKAVNSLTGESENGKILALSDNDNIYIPDKTIDDVKCSIEDSNESDKASEEFSQNKPNVQINQVKNPKVNNSFKGNGCVYRLHLQLTGDFYSGADKGLDFSGKNRNQLFKLAKAEKGISRDILVPGSMSLHALHYAIQRLFGWQNSHLHNFSLSEKDFNKVTDNGTFGDYMKLCGVLFRFVDDISDECWDDDYKEGISIKSWFKKKYSAPFLNGSVGDSYYGNQFDIFRFNENYPQFSPEDTIKDVNRQILLEPSPNHLIERLSIGELLLPSSTRNISLRSWKRDISLKKVQLEDIIENESIMMDKMQADANELIRWRQSNDELENITWRYEDTYREEIERRTGLPYEKVVYANSYELNYWKRKCKKMLNEWNILLKPYFHELYYLYDYGDDWCIKITTDNVYQRKSNNDGEIIYIDKNNELSDTELNEKLLSVDSKGQPICIATDGLNLVDDCGGINGYLDMLKTINDSRREAADEMMNWARSLGWTGRKDRPEKML